MPAPEIIHQLVARFTENRAAYRSGKYNEAQLRQEFLDPFFEALGWDVYNKHGYALEYRDVIIEDSLEIEGTSKAPDYAFKIGRERKFYAEAKKPAVDIKYDIHPAYQLRRYAWNAHMALSILTDFEELAVYNCKDKPNPTDSAATSREKLYRYTEYEDKWDEIAEIFSRESVWKGSLDKPRQRGKGTTEVDDAFLKDIEEWRTLLARNLALRNPHISGERPLNYAVQMTIDRIIFLRICEDRGIEPDEQLKELTQSPGIYPRLVELFKKADSKYNSGLFHFATEKGESTAPDTFTPGLTIDDRVLKEIITSIYYPCPYIFKEIPVEILGQVYEQFLGKVIRLTPGHQAKVEEKPEVRKAGGVYYTPKYIVDYIVTQTVGKLLEGKTPAEAAALKIVDPACGSGSFLLGAFQHLLDWHLNWYTASEPEKYAKGRNPALVQSAGGGWRLTTEKKKEILVNNIHGVDIDPQAVEVTKLSLLLKVLEEETGQMSFVQERVLPDLGRNIQCGNSLIGEDYFSGRLVVEEGERERVNPFEWQRAFALVFKQGGFDAVIGNPPWGAELDKQSLGYLKIHNKEIVVRMTDTFMFFVYQIQKYLKDCGYFGMILPDVILYQKDNIKLRKYLLDFKLYAYINLGNVFKRVNRPACIITYKKDTDNQKNHVFVLDASKATAIEKQMLISSERYMMLIAQANLRHNENLLFITGHMGDYDILQKIKLKNPRHLMDFIDNDGIQRGASPDYKDAFIVDSSIARKYMFEEGKIKKVLTGGKQVKRYFIYYDNQYLIYLRNSDDFRKYPKICAYIDLYKHKITCKEVQEGKHSMYSLHRPRQEEIFTKREKIVGVITEDEIVVALDTDGYFASDGIYLFGVNERVSPLYILGILNSKLVKFIYRLISLEEGRGLAQVKPTLINTIPIPEIDDTNPVDRQLKNSLIMLVRQMLKTNPVAPQTPQEQETFNREHFAIDRRIDDLVYKLYGLTEEEIRLVEGE